MKIIRYSDSQGKIDHAAQQADEAAFVIEGDILGGHRAPERKAETVKLLNVIQHPGGPILLPTRLKSVFM